MLTVRSLSPKKSLELVLDARSGVCGTIVSLCKYPERWLIEENAEHQGLRDCELRGTATMDRRDLRSSLANRINSVGMWYE